MCDSSPPRVDHNCISLGHPNLMPCQFLRKGMDHFHLLGELTWRYPTLRPGAASYRTETRGKLEMAEKSAVQIRMPEGVLARVLLLIPFQETSLASNASCSAPELPPHLSSAIL